MFAEAPARFVYSNDKTLRLDASCRCSSTDFWMCLYTVELPNVTPLSAAPYQGINYIFYCQTCLYYSYENFLRTLRTAFWNKTYYFILLIPEQLNSLGAIQKTQIGTNTEQFLSLIGRTGNRPKDSPHIANNWVTELERVVSKGG